jgi:hypothetical protein
MHIGGPQALPEPARLGVDLDNLGIRKQVSALGRVMAEAGSRGDDTRLAALREYPFGMLRAAALSFSE